MKLPTRILLALLAPGPLGLLLFLVLNPPNSDQLWMLQPLILIRYLFAAWLVTLIPAAVYAFIMETWRRADIHPLNGRIGTCAVSTVLGISAGCAVYLATEAQVIAVGGFVGAILGLVLSWRPVPRPAH